LGFYSPPLAAYLNEDGLIPRLPATGKFIEIERAAAMEGMTAIY